MAASSDLTNFFAYFHLKINLASNFQGALPQIFENTNEEFFSKIKKTLGQGADLCYGEIKGIPCFTCPSKPEGSMFVMVRYLQKLFC